MSSTATGIGASVRRKEDFRFITGHGQYTDDVVRPGETRAVWMPFVLPMRDKAGAGTPIFPQHSPVLQAREVIRREVFEIRSAAEQFRGGRPTRRAHDREALPAGALVQANPRPRVRSFVKESRSFQKRDFPNRRAVREARTLA